RSGAWIWTFLVERKHYGIHRWINMKTEDTGELRGKPESRDRLKIRKRCGCRWFARQVRCTELSEMLNALAIARPVQWAPGGAVRCRACPREGGGQRHRPGRSIRRMRRFAGLAGPVAPHPLRSRFSQAP